MNRFLSKLSVVGVLALSTVAAEAAQTELVGKIQSVGPRGRQMVYRHVPVAGPHALTGEVARPERKMERVPTLGGMRDRTPAYRWVDVK